jgi:hypothetical protein
VLNTKKNRFCSPNYTFMYLNCKTFFSYSQSGKRPLRFCQVQKKLVMGKPARYLFCEPPLPFLQPDQAGNKSRFFNFRCECARHADDLLVFTVWNYFRGVFLFFFHNDCSYIFRIEAGSFSMSLLNCLRKITSMFRD